MINPTNVCNPEDAPQWDHAVPYSKDSIVRGSDGNLYLATCDNLNQPPV